MPASPPSAASSTSQAWILEPRDGAARDLRVFGLTPAERLRRTLVRAGCAVRRVDEDAPPVIAADERVVLLRADRVLDERVVEALVAAPDTWLEHASLGALGAHVSGADAGKALAALRGAGPAPEHLRRATPEALVPAYQEKLRKRQPPWVCEARPELAAEIEQRIFDASYKGVTDLVTRWVWPRPAQAATRWCAQRGVTPNAVTLASWVLAIAAALLFAAGWFGLGLACAWSMTFLDTVDGKLARVTLTSSRFGDVLDHGLDLLHPPFWYLAWGFGLTEPEALAAGIAVAGYVAGRALEGVFLAAFEFEAHSWRPIDALFRTITARRNPNLILLSVGWLGRRPDLGLVMVAAWTIVSIAFHSVRLWQAFSARRRGEAVRPWDAG